MVNSLVDINESSDLDTYILSEIEVEAYFAFTSHCWSKVDAFS